MKYYCTEKIEGINKNSRWLTLYTDKVFVDTREGFFSLGIARLAETDSERMVVKFLEEIDKIKGVVGAHVYNKHELHVNIGLMFGITKIRKQVIAKIRNYFAPGEGVFKCGEVGQVLS